LLALLPAGCQIREYKNMRPATVKPAGYASLTGRAG